MQWAWFNLISAKHLMKFPMIFWINSRTNFLALWALQPIAWGLGMRGWPLLMVFKQGLSEILLPLHTLWLYLFKSMGFEGCYPFKDCTVLCPNMPIFKYVIRTLQMKTRILGQAGDIFSAWCRKSKSPCFRSLSSCLLLPAVCQFTWVSYWPAIPLSTSFFFLLLHRNLTHQ